MCMCVRMKALRADAISSHVHSVTCTTATCIHTRHLPLGACPRRRTATLRVERLHTKLRVHKHMLCTCNRAHTHTYTHTHMEYTHANTTLAHARRHAHEHANMHPHSHARHASMQRRTQPDAHTKTKHACRHKTLAYTRCAHANMDMRTHAHTWESLHMYAHARCTHAPVT